MIQVTYKGHMGNDLTVVNAARVSFGKESEWDYAFSHGWTSDNRRNFREQNPRVNGQAERREATNLYLRGRR